MNNQIVWVFGTAAAGKETFIKYCSQEKPSMLFSELCWIGKEVVPCKESMQWVAQYPGDPLGDYRKELLRVVPKLSKENSGAVILIKGQDLDLYAHRLTQLRSIIPDDDHQIIFLDGDADQQFERWKKKPWFRKDYSVETVKNHVLHQVALLQKVPLVIRAICAASVENYLCVDFPPVAR